MKSLMSHFYRACERVGILDLDNWLETCAMYGRTSRIEPLLEAGANIHADNDEALRTAAWWGRTKTVQVLLENGADVHAKNDQARKWAKDADHPETASVIEDWMSNHPIPVPHQP